MTLVWQPGYAGLDDPDAAAYITNVEAADLAAGQSGGLEDEVKLAIHNFVKGCKNDGIWPAIKASCILAGARTTNGALVPLVGTAPTPNNFDLVGDTDYDRKTGLKGDGSTKYLDSNRLASAQPQNSVHIAVYGTTVQTNATNMLIGALSFDAAQRATLFPASATVLYCQLHFGSNYNASHASLASGFIGGNRSNSTEITTRAAGASITGNATSNAPPAVDYFIFARNFSGPSQYSTSRLAFYSIGESLDLAALDTRVSALITAIGAAIP